MKESVAVAKEVDAKKGFSPTRSDNSISIHRVRNEPERQLGSLRSVIGDIRNGGGTPSVDSIASELSGMPTVQRASVLLALQRTHGNQYVQRVVAGIQAKLVVGQPGDIYEQEADRVADAVMRMPEPQAQRQVELEEEEKELLQGKPLAEQITPLVQRQVETEEDEEEEEIQTKQLPSSAPEIIPDVETRINSIRGGGQPLPGSTRAFFEPRFGYDFSQVRVHTDAKAADTARAVNARAFTRGHDVVFGAGQYAPGTTAGQRLLAHELTHVVQQRAGTALKPALAASIQHDSKVYHIQKTIRGQPSSYLCAGREILQLSANTCTYGEIRSWAVTSMSNHTPPAGLADAKASIGAVCARGESCTCIDGSTAASEPADQAAWRNIVNATGGSDLTGGGNRMCVGHQRCLVVHSCYSCVDGRKTLVRRPNNLPTSGTCTVTGKGTLYFYNDRLREWCNREDYISGCRSS